MGSIIKTISLDSRTQKIAATIPNFSQWIRAKLLELEEKRVTPTHGYRYTCPDCTKYWVFAVPKQYIYCNVEDCGCPYELSVTEEVVSLE
tara:strand:- start:996 stop:1265 length:270 start_codon:yes stop_codon:yes gene_type:complete